MEASFRALLASEFAPYGKLTELQLDRLDSHYALLCKWNRKINLTRFQSLPEAVALHYCESLYLAQSLPPGPLRIADVGSGAGFPGFPIAVYREECAVDLIESDQRKAAFLRETRFLAPNVKVFAARADAVHDGYDWVVSRAVRAEEVLALRLAPNIALLSSEHSLAKVPWGTQRYIQTFHVEH